MFYKNARIFASDFRFHTGAFAVRDGLFGEVLPENVPADAVDLNGATVIPGLIDVHSHGNSGADFSDGDYEGLKRMAAFYARCGVTSFAPASMTLPYDVLEKAFATARQLHAEAPELPGAAEFVAKAKTLCTVSIAHTDSDYDHARAAIDAGATHLTHLYNAMPPIHHRNPGVIPAAVETPGVQAEIICDGYHIHPAAVRLAFTMFRDRMVLISDSGRCAGEPEGTKFQLGGQDAWLRGGVAKLADGTIACSATNLWTCLQNVLKWNVPEEEAVRAATFNPAKAIGAADKVGTIETGKLADFVVTNGEYTQKRVFIGGKEI
ncbi:MAG: N-acetylglucosamine-6-phosphate deacetylase [Clostridiales bacterium]|nr:N-acetylglucosamine-6-phosphate deacetylase [Clostridiales bacterium]